MKLAVVAERVEAWRGGAETSTLQFLQHLVRKTGFDITLITTSREPSRPGLKVLTLPIGKTQQWMRTVRFAERAAQVAANGSFDVVHAISPCLAADIYQPRGGTWAETVERNLALRRTRWRRALKRLTNSFNAKHEALLTLERRLLTRTPPPMVIALSGYVADQLRRHYDVPESAIRIVWNGVDADNAPAAQRHLDREEIRTRFNIENADLAVLLVAHNFKLKGVREWLETAACAKGDLAAPLKTLVVGRDNPLPYMQLSRKLGLGDSVHFVGPTQRIFSFCHAADLLVHLTYYDPFSRVVLEAMTSGLPTITTRYNGVCDVIQNGDNGFWVSEPGSRDEVVQCLRALSAPEERTRMGQAAAAAGAKLSMDAHVEKLLELYEIAAGREKIRGHPQMSRIDADFRENSRRKSAQSVD